MNLLTMEGEDILMAAGSSGEWPVYILLTNTNSLFQRIARRITKDPYNHVSLALDADLNTIYSYSLFSKENGIFGGLVKETRERLLGSKYSMYTINLTENQYTLVYDKLRKLEDGSSNTSYNRLGLFNAIFNKDIFKDENDDQMICSQFVDVVLRAAGIELLNDKLGSRVKPYDFVKSRLLRFVRRGVIKPIK